MSPPFFHKKNNYRIGLKISDASVSLLIFDYNVSRGITTSPIRVGIAPDIEVKKEPTLENSLLKEPLMLKESICLELSDKVTITHCQQVLTKLIIDKHLVGQPCFCVLDDSHYELLLVDTPLVPDDEIKDALRWKVQELINSDIDAVAIESFKQPNKNKTYAAVSKKETVNQIANFVAEIGLKLISIDIPELSYRNLIDHIAAAQTDSYVMSDVETNIEHKLSLGQSTALLIVCEGEGHLLIFKDGNIYLSRKFSFRSAGDKEIDSLEDALIVEIQRSLDYFERQTGEVIPNTILFIDSRNSIVTNKYVTLLKKNLHQNIVPLQSKNILHDCELFQNEADMLMLCGAALRAIAA